MYSTDDDDFVYLVTLWDKHGNAMNVSGLSRDYFAFVDRPYSTDMHLRWAFRHRMMIPDAMFPQETGGNNNSDLFRLMRRATSVVHRKASACFTWILYGIS